MLSYSKISSYKVKKILKCFSKDFSASETAKLLKLNIKTINRYYNIFRKIALKLSIKNLKSDSENVRYIGWVRASYCEKSYFKIYKKDKKTFFFTDLPERPKDIQSAVEDNDFQKYLDFVHQRLSKFYGFTGKSYYYQLFECSIKYKYSEVELFNIIWKQLLKTHKINIQMDKTDITEPQKF